MKALIIAGGDLGDVEFIKKNIGIWDYAICVDSGARHLKALEIKPDLLIGDFDSISETKLNKLKAEGVPVLEYPEEKDWTDTQIAVDYLIERNFEEVYILAGLGDRMDHSYANIMLLYRMLKKGIKSKIVHSKNIIELADDEIIISCEFTKTISLLPFAGDVEIENTWGLYYPLNNLKLYMDNPLGISNILLDKKATIKISKGCLMVVLARD